MKPFKPENDRAFTVLELMVVVFVIALLAAIMLPGISRRHKKAALINCVNNIKQVGLSFRMWAGDNGDIYPMHLQTTNFDGPSYANSKQMFIYFQVMSNELNTPKVLICPEDKTRSAATNFTTDFDSRRISYFVGLDTDETLPQSVLAGDSNLKVGSVPANGVVNLGTNQISWLTNRHGDGGNITLGDGSVMKLSTPGLKGTLAATGVATNRIVLPEDVK